MIGVLGLLFFLFVLNLGINTWIKYRLPNLINEKNESAYSITYQNVDVSLLNLSIKASDIVIIPKLALKKPNVKSGLYAKVKTVEVKKFQFWSILFSNKIKAKSIHVSEPKVILYKNDDKAINNYKSINSRVVTPFEKIIKVSDIYLINGEAKIIYTKTNTPVLTVSNINLTIDGIVINENTLKNKIPFTFTKYKINCDSLYYHPNKFYHLKTKKIFTSENSFLVSQFKLVPEDTRQEFTTKIAMEKDQFTIFSKEIKINKLEWGIKSEKLFVNAQSLRLQDLDANVYRNKLPNDDLRKKDLYNKLLRELDFNLKLDTLEIRNSLLTYEEEKSFEKGAGKLTFNNFNLTAYNIHNDINQEISPELNINVDCKFMNTSPLKINWTLNVMDKNDGFHIKGSLLNFDTKKIIPFTKPYMNITPEGILNETYFNFTGNNTTAKGDFAIKYDDLNFTVYKKKNRDEKNKLLSFVGNLLIKNDSEGEIKKTSVELERIQEKSFYNFLWRLIAEGMKKTFI